MKCLCGYEKIEKWNSEDGEEVGDEKFILVNFGLYPQVRRDYFEDYKIEVYACPKCGTLKIDV